MIKTTLHRNLGVVVRFSFLNKPAPVYFSVATELQSLNAANRSRYGVLDDVHGECSFFQKELALMKVLDRGIGTTNPMVYLTDTPLSLPAPSLGRPCFVVRLKMALTANIGDCFLFHKYYSALVSKH